MFAKSVRTPERVIADQAAPKPGSADKLDHGLQ